MPIDTMVATPMDVVDDDMETGVVLHSRRQSRDLTLDQPYSAESPVGVPFHTRSISHSSSFQPAEIITFITSPVDDDADNSVYTPQDDAMQSPVTPNLRVESMAFDPSVSTPSKFSPISTQVEPRNQPKRTRSKPRQLGVPNETTRIVAEPTPLRVDHRLDSGHRQTKRPSDFDESSTSASPNAEPAQNPFEEFNNRSSQGFVDVDQPDVESSDESSVHSEPESDLDRLGPSNDINILYASDNSPYDDYDDDDYTASQLRRRRGLAKAKSSKKIEVEDDDEDSEDVEDEDVGGLVEPAEKTPKKNRSSKASQVVFDESVPFLGRIASIDENIAATPMSNGQNERNFPSSSQSSLTDVRMIPSPYINQSQEDQGAVVYTLDSFAGTPPASLPATDTEFLENLPSLTLQLIQRSEGKSLTKTPQENNTSTPSENSRRTPKMSPEKYRIVDSDDEDDGDSSLHTTGSSSQKRHRQDALSVDSTNLESAFNAFDSRTNATRAGVITITPSDPNMPTGIESLTSGSETLIHRSPREEVPPNIENSTSKSQPPFPGVSLPSSLPPLPQGTSRSRYDASGGGASPQPPIVERRASQGPLRRAATMSNLSFVRQTPAKRKSKGKKEKNEKEPSSAHTPTYRRKSESSDDTPKFPNGRVRRAKSSISIPKGLKILNPDHRERVDALERNLHFSNQKIKRLERENRKYREFCRDMGFDPDALPESPIPLSQAVSKFDHAKQESDVTPMSMAATSVTTDDATPSQFNLRHVKANKSLSTSASNSKSSFIGRSSGGMYDDLQSSLISTVTTHDDLFLESQRMKDQIKQLKRDLEEGKQHIASYESQLGNLHEQLKTTRQANMALAAERERDQEKLSEAIQDKYRWEALFDEARQSKSQLAELVSGHLSSLRAQLLRYQVRYGTLGPEDN